MNRNKLKRLLLSLSLLLVALSFVKPADAQDKIVLKAITPWPSSYYWSKPMEFFQQMVEERLNGRLEIQYLGAGEVVPPFEQLEALRNGVVDVILGAASYYAGTVPEANGVLLSKLPPSQLRTNGYYQIMRELHATKGGVVYLANVGGTPGKAFRLFTSVKLDSSDLTGRKIRVTPVYADLVKALGGTPITMKPSEVYTAMERGVIDGYGWSYGGITDFAWQEVTKYVIDHPFFMANTSILLNQKAWDSLPTDVKAELEEIGVELEKKSESFLAEYNVDEDDRLSGMGISFIEFAPDDAKHFIDLAYQVGWDNFIAQNPDVGPRMKELSE